MYWYEGSHQYLQKAQILAPFIPVSTRLIVILLSLTVWQRRDQSFGGFDGRSYFISGSGNGCFLLLLALHCGQGSVTHLISPRR